MTIKHLSAFVALGALSFVVACSSGNGSVVPSNTGTTPDAAHAAVSTNADLLATLADAIANKTSPIKVKPAALAFTAIGAAHAKNFTISEARYKGVFHIAKSCKAQIGLSAIKASGPSAKIGVTPLENVGRCVVTVSDSSKNKAVVDVSVDLVTPPTPSASPSGSPSPTASPSHAPSPSASPSTAPSASPSTGPSGAPSPGVVQNGNFATGTLAGWTACSFAHNAYAAPVNASPAPQATGAQSGMTTAITPPASNGTVAAPPQNYNPNNSGAIPALGSYVALTGDNASESDGTSGICQQISPTATNHFLSFYAYEGGTEYNFKYADQEADILDSTGTTVQTTLLAELNCFYYPTGGIGSGTYTASGCMPQSLGGSSAYTDWVNGGYWVPRGPYDLTAYEGQTVTLFLGVWSDSTHAGPTSYGNGMYVGNVQLTSTNTFPTTFSARRHQPNATRPAAKRLTPPNHSY